MNKDTAFHWNLGGWLGAQLGGTCWILVAGLLAIRHEASVGVTVLALFVLPNLIGWRLWRSQERLSAYRDLQAMALVAGAFGLAAVYVLDGSGLWETIQVGGRASAGRVYLIIIGVVAALLVLFRSIARQSE